MPEKIVLSWSGGKDCSYALYEMEKNPDYKIAGLLTTLNSESSTISMHEIHKYLLDSQIASLNYHSDIILMPAIPSNETYIKNFQGQLRKYKSQGITAIAFADLFLEDIKEFRTKLVEAAGLKAVFPLWRRNTGQLAVDFIKAGFKAVVTCVDTCQLNKSFSGREFDLSFLQNLPKGVDPCGENGEFHTFVYDGPGFNHEIRVKNSGYRFINERFYCCDLNLKQSNDPHR